MTLQNGGLELILNLHQRYSAVERIRGAIANFYNRDYAPYVDLLGLSRCLDKEHYELFLDVLYTMRNDNTALGKCGITVINDIYIEMMERGFRPRFPEKPEDWDKVYM